MPIPTQRRTPTGSATKRRGRLIRAARTVYSSIVTVVSSPLSRLRIITSLYTLSSRWRRKCSPCRRRSQRTTVPMVFAVQRFEADLHFVRGFDPIARLQFGEQLAAGGFGGRMDRCNRLHG